MRKSYMFALGKSLSFGEVGGALLFYRYDASGERDLKLTGVPMEMWQNGRYRNVAVYDQATLYASGLMTVSEKGYTKHYFAEGERIASSIGGGIPSVGTWDEVPVIMGDYGSILENYDNFVADYFVNNWFNTLPAYEDADDAYGGAWWEDPQFEILREFFDENGFPYELWYEGTLKDVFPYLLEQRYGIPAQKIENKTLSEIVEYLYSDWGEDLNVPVLRGAEWQGGSLADDYNYYINRSDPDELYYFHSDHLGSGSVITNGNSGDAYQTLAYAPFGETLMNLRNGDYDEPYKFTGYERDEETGFDYAHARYYWSDLGIFTSVDPLAEKYPGISSYAYCLNNPLIYKDLDGRAPGDAFVTRDDAAADWGNYYNGVSIKRNREYGSVIYSKTVDGKLMYYYTKAKKGSSRSVRIPFERVPEDGNDEATIHSHGAYYKGEVKGEFEIISNDFSDMDRELAIEEDLDSYLTNPGGELKVLDAKTGDEKTIRTDMPKDTRMDKELETKEIETK